MAGTERCMKKKEFDMKVSVGTMPLNPDERREETTIDPQIVKVLDQLEGEGLGGFLWDLYRILPSVPSLLEYYTGLHRTTTESQT